VDRGVHGLGSGHPVPSLLENLLDIYRDFLTAGNLEGAEETRRVILATFPQN
jgi:hypothetical protein